MCRSIAPLPEDATRLRHSRLAKSTVQWKHGRQPVSIIDTLWGGFCLKFHVEQAKLYSFTLTWEQ